MIKPIETQYKGYRFRSRLEARYAVMFDALGVEWEYEPEGFEFDNGMKYLPDFRIFSVDRARRKKESWIEVKGCEPNEIEKQKMKLLERETGCLGFFLIGPPGENITGRVGSMPPFDLIRKNVGTVNNTIAFMFFGVSDRPSNWEAMIEDSIEAARSARFEFGECP